MGSLFPKVELTVKQKYVILEHCYLILTQDANPLLSLLKRMILKTA